MSLLVVDNLDVSINGTPILQEVSLKIAPGEILGLIGESGSGKSMTALAVMQLLPKGSMTRGAITLGGQDVLAASESQLCDMRGRDVAMVFQEPMSALNPVQTIGEQVAETIFIHEPNTSKADAYARAAQVLRRCELSPEQFPLSRFPHELSGGQRQRVVIAMAIALQPRLLIADEPTTALDVTTQREVLALLKRLVDEDGMGMMLISHDLAVVTELAQDIVILRAGRVLERGPARSLHRTMRHPYTKALFVASAHRPERKAMSLAEPLLEARHVIRDYSLPRKSLLGPVRKFRAVDDVSFTIHKGENLGLVGESGCGKSTLSRAILGLEPLQGGSIMLDGRAVGVRAHALRRKMQVVFQDPYSSFNPRHRVARLIAEPFHLLARKPGRDELDDALVSVGMAPSDKEKYIHEFSGGQRQRIAIARALIIRPELIVLDEAVSALDVSVRAQILDLLAELSERFGLTYLFISHDLSVVRAVTDRVLVMQAGRIVEQGETETIFTTPSHPYTKDLIAAVPRLPDDLDRMEGPSHVFRKEP